MLLCAGCGEEGGAEGEATERTEGTTVSATHSEVHGDAGTSDSDARYEADEAAVATLAAVRDDSLRVLVVAEEDLRVLRETYRRYPESPAVREILLDALELRGDWQGIATVLGDHPPTTAERRLQLVRALLEIGEHEAAVAAIDPLHALEPRSPELSWLAARARHRLGRTAEAASILDASWQQITVNNREHLGAMTLRAQLFFEEGRHARARSLFERVVERDDTLSTIEAQDGLGRTLIALGEEEAAREVFARLDALNVAKEQYDRDRQRAYTRARTLVRAIDEGRLGDAEEALASLRTESDPRHQRIAAEQAARLYEALGRPTEAAHARATATALSPRGSQP